MKHSNHKVQVISLESATIRQMEPPRATGISQIIVVESVSTPLKTEVEMTAAKIIKVAADETPLEVQTRILETSTLVAAEAAARTIGAETVSKTARKAPN